MKVHDRLVHLKIDFPQKSSKIKIFSNYLINIELEELILL